VSPIKFIKQVFSESFAKILRHINGREKVLFKEVLKMGKAAFQVAVSFLFVVFDKFLVIIEKIRLEFMRRDNSGSMAWRSREGVINSLPIPSGSWCHVNGHKKCDFCVPIRVPSVSQTKRKKAEKSGT
jgi:hypothetical protein